MNRNIFQGLQPRRVGNARHRDFAGVPAETWQGVALLLLLIGALSIYVFFDHLLWNRLYLFTDIGSDSVNGYLPRMLHLSDYLRAEGWPGWSFSVGMGQNLFPGSIANPFDLILLALGREHLAYGIVYVTVLKSIFGGLCFFFYLRTLGLLVGVAVVGGLCFAFSGLMVVGGGWSIFATEAAYIALLLWAFERYLLHGSWRLFALSCALMAVENPVSLYTAGLFFIIYAGVRHVDLKGWQPLDLLGLYLRLLGLGVLGVAMGGIFVVPHVLQMLESPRGLGAASYASTLEALDFWRFAAASQYSSFVARLFSSDLLGTGNSYRGWANYLESPLVYVGLAPLIFAPLGWWGMDRRRRWLYGSFVGILSVMVLLPYLRQGFWLFSGDYYRAFSLYAVFPILLLGLYGLNHAVRKDSASPRLLLGSTFVLAAVVFVLPYFSGPLDTPLRNAVLGFIVAYGVLGWSLSRRQWRGTASVLLLLVVVLELGHFSATSVAQRTTLDGDYFSGPAGYHDTTLEALDYLRQHDPSPYRIAKGYYSSPATQHDSLNDAQAQGFWGILSYHSFNQLNYVRFLAGLGVIDLDNEHMSRWISAPVGQPVLLLFSGVKYFLARGDEGFRLDERIVRPMARVGDVDVFELPLALPLAFTYDRFMTLAAFRELSKLEKQSTLLQAVVVDDPALIRHTGLQPFEHSDEHSNLLENMSQRTEHPFQISSHSHNHIQGRILLDSPRLLHFTIPYDAGWRAAVDGQPVPLERVNIGFTGLPLSAGEHRVELHYRQPYQLPSLALSVVGVSVFLLFRKRQPRPAGGDPAHRE